MKGVTTMLTFACVLAGIACAQPVGDQQQQQIDTSAQLDRVEHLLEAVERAHPAEAEEVHHELCSERCQDELVAVTEESEGAVLTMCIEMARTNDVEVTDTLSVLGYLRSHYPDEIAHQSDTFWHDRIAEGQVAFRVALEAERERQAEHEATAAAEGTEHVMAAEERLPVPPTASAEHLD
jgi:hypothetical protein